ncbi:MAG: zinc ribbon-containing protein [Gammaproteobacteria bacterium]|nr:zinc ribbon-containing protein [Gammaproteobacteria bacterium]
MTDNNTHNTEKLVHAYNRMLERVKALIDQAEKETSPAVQKALQAAREKAVELGEVTQEEANKVSDYLKRDLDDAAHYLKQTESQLSEWFKFELELIEIKVLELFSSMADHTREELDKLSERARKQSEWRTGEVTGIGTLHCVDCGQEMHFHSTGHIPPCPKCHKTVFKR